MAASEQVQSGASEEEVRAAIVAAMEALEGVKVTENVPGQLVVETGSVGMALVAGGFRKAEKMPMKIVVATNGGPTGTGLSVTVDSRGTGGGISGGLLGIRKQKQGEQHWLQQVVNAVPQRV